MTRGRTAWASHRARSPRPTRENDLLLRARVEVDLQAAAQGVRDRPAPLRLLADAGELAAIDPPNPSAPALNPRDLILSPPLPETAPARARDGRLSPLPVLRP